MEALMQDINDFTRISHRGKTAVVHDFAVSRFGDLFYLAMCGPQGVVNGIFAALVNNGEHNVEVVNILPGTDFANSDSRGDLGGQGVDAFRVRIPNFAVGSMKKDTQTFADHKTGRNLRAVYLYTEMIRADYDYRHVERHTAEKKNEMTKEALRLNALDLARFVLLRNVGKNETDAELAARWYGFLTRRLDDPLHGSWALPLFEHCLANGVGVRKLVRLRGDGYLCEPDRDEMRKAVCELGKAGRLLIPDDQADRLALETVAREPDAVELDAVSEGEVA